jgi:hypothetical protein
MKMLQISIFPTRSEAGLQLAKSLSDLIAAHTGGVQPKVFNRFAQELTQSQFLEACLHDDLVIFDATREPGGENNFDIANEHPKTMSHILVVSRNYLPINFFGVNKGGCPTYSQAQKSNDEIVAWFKKLLEEEGVLQKRPDDEKGLQFQKAMFRNIEQRNREQNQAARIFISHRTKYQFQKGFPSEFKKNVRELTDEIAAGNYHEQKPQTVKILSNGELAYPTEVLSPGRKWQIYAMLDNHHIIHCDEFWIYASEDYLNSWWCRAELVAFAYVNDLNSGVRSRRLRWYDPVEDKVYDVPQEDYPQLTEAQKNRISRIYTNTNPDTMGPESVRTMQMMRPFMAMMKADPNFRELAQQQFEMMKELMTMGGDDSPAKGMFDQFTFDDFFNTASSEEYLDDPVFQPEFWEKLCFESAWREENKRPLKRFDLKFDVDNFLELQEPEHVLIDPSQIRGGKIHLGGDETKKLRTEAPRFLWLPSRMGRDVSERGDNLEMLPTWVVDED